MNSLSIKMLFEDTNVHIKNYLNVNINVPRCLDQPFLVYNSFIQDKYDNQFMKNYLENNPNGLSNEKIKIIYHFPGDYPNKSYKMGIIWNKIEAKHIWINQEDNFNYRFCFT